MSRFRKLSHTVWHCQYHIAWVPKYRLRIPDASPESLINFIGTHMSSGIYWGWWSQVHTPVMENASENGLIDLA